MPRFRRGVLRGRRSNGGGGRRWGSSSRRSTPATSHQGAATRRVQQSPANRTQTAQSSSSNQSRTPSTDAQKNNDKVEHSSPPPSNREETQAKEKANNLLGNMFGKDGLGSLLSGDGMKSLAGATKSFEFNDEERKRAESGLAALKKMAGKDGVLTPADRENIIGQMDRALTAEKNRTVNSIANQKIQQAKNNRGPLRKALFPRAPLISKVGAKRKAEALRDPQHMQTARNQALGELNQGFQQMGMDTGEGVSYSRGLQAARGMPEIGLQDTNAFKDTMLMVQEKAKSMGLPEGKFKKGLPVAFLEDVLGGKPAMSLLKHQMNPFGK